MKLKFFIPILLLVYSCDIFWSPLEEELFTSDHILTVSDRNGFFNDNTAIINVLDLDSSLVKDRSFLFTEYEDILNNDEEIWVFKRNVIRVLNQKNLDFIETILNPISNTDANYILEDRIFSIEEDILYAFTSFSTQILDTIPLRNNSRNYQFFNDLLFYSSENTLYNLNLDNYQLDSIIFNDTIRQLTAEEFKVGVITGTDEDFSVNYTYIDNLENFIELDISVEITRQLNANKSLGFIKNRIVLLSDDEIYLTESPIKIDLDDQLDFDEVSNFGLNHIENHIYTINNEIIQFYDIDRETMEEFDHNLVQFNQFFIID